MTCRYFPVVVPVAHATSEVRSAPEFGSSIFIDEVNLKIPKFKVNSKFDAANALKIMEVNKAFGSEAELDKFVSGGPIALGKVISEAFVEVTKNGTEATAAIGVELVLLSASPVKVKNIIRLLFLI